MCLIVHKPAGATVPYALMTEAFETNKDGLGWVTDRAEVAKIAHVKRRHVKQLARDLNTRLIDRAVAIHFRWRTHGRIDVANTHPYALSDGGFLMHNGVLRCGSFLDPDKSDTWHYINHDLFGLSSEPDAPHWAKVATDIGWGNKFLIVTPRGAMHIVNKQAGTMYRGLWLSNKYSTPWLFAPVRPRYTKALTVETHNALQRSVADALHRRQYGATKTATVSTVPAPVPAEYAGLYLANEYGTGPDGLTDAERLELAEARYPLSRVPS